MIHDAHAFRGEYIDVCAQIERWAVEVIRNAETSAGAPRKMPHLLGQKLKLVAELASDDTIFAKPMRVRELLARLQPYIDLRSHLAHATMTVTGEGTAEIYAFDLPGADGPPSCGGRFWLTPGDGRSLLSRLKKNRKELSDQKLRSGG
jgi:hypothetical protein